jgi:hypothetical protein
VVDRERSFRDSGGAALERVVRLEAENALLRGQLASAQQATPVFPSPLTTRTTTPSTGASGVAIAVAAIAVVAALLALTAVVVAHGSRPVDSASTSERSERGVASKDALF